MTGNLDARKACTGAMKLHKKYLKKVVCSPQLTFDVAYPPNCKTPKKTKSFSPLSSYFRFSPVFAAGQC